MEKLPERKDNRLKNYDYSKTGYYYVTICTKDKRNYFGDILLSRGGALLHPDTSSSNINLSDMGKIIYEQWLELKNRYPSIDLDKFVIMPNHIHGIIILDNLRAEQSPAPTIGDIVCAYKSITSRLANKKDKKPGRIIWQRSYYDHIIRNERDLFNIRKYIEENPLKWREDKYYMLGSSYKD